MLSQARSRKTRLVRVTIDTIFALQQVERDEGIEVRRSHPETVLKVLNLSPGEQIIAVRGGEIDIMFGCLGKL
jgi:hypothetical protein